MVADIRFEPTDIWKVFQADKEKLRTTMKQIAENAELGVVIYLTEEDRGDTMLPNFVVYLDGSELYEECAVNENDCAQTAKKIYYDYLTGDRLINKIIEQDKQGQLEEDDDQDDNEEMIENRENELDTAVYDFLCEVFEEPLDNIVGKKEAGEIYEDFKDHALEYIARKWDLEIYRPMILEDEDGTEFFEEYPYDVLEFEDQDNPIYK